jgi:hypothetical protein
MPEALPDYPKTVYKEGQARIPKQFIRRVRPVSQARNAGSSAPPPPHTSVFVLLYQ